MSWGGVADLLADTRGPQIARVVWLTNEWPSLHESIHRRSSVDAPLSKEDDQNINFWSNKSVVAGVFSVVAVISTIMIVSGVLFFRHQKILAKRNTLVPRPRTDSVSFVTPSRQQTTGANVSRSTTAPSLPKPPNPLLFPPNIPLPPTPPPPRPPRTDEQFLPLPPPKPNQAKTASTCSRLPRSHLSWDSRTIASIYFKKPEPSHAPGGHHSASSSIDFNNLAKNLPTPETAPHQSKIPSRKSTQDGLSILSDGSFYESHFGNDEKDSQKGTPQPANFGGLNLPWTSRVDKRRGVVDMVGTGRNTTTVPMSPVQEFDIQSASSVSIVPSHPPLPNITTQSRSNSQKSQKLPGQSKPPHLAPPAPPGPYFSPFPSPSPSHSSPPGQYRSVHHLSQHPQIPNYSLPQPYHTRAHFRSLSANTASSSNGGGASVRRTQSAGQTGSPHIHPNTTSVSPGGTDRIIPQSQLYASLREFGHGERRELPHTIETGVGGSPEIVSVHRSLSVDSLSISARTATPSDTTSSPGTYEERLGIGNESLREFGRNNGGAVGRGGGGEHDRDRASIGAVRRASPGTSSLQQPLPPLQQQQQIPPLPRQAHRTPPIQTVSEPQQRPSFSQDRSEQRPAHAQQIERHPYAYPRNPNPSNDHITTPGLSIHPYAQVRAYE